MFLLKKLYKFKGWLEIGGELVRRRCFPGDGGLEGKWKRILQAKSYCLVGIGQ